MLILFESECVNMSELETFYDLTFFPLDYLLNVLGYRVFVLIVWLHFFSHS